MDIYTFRPLDLAWTYGKFTFYFQWRVFEQTFANWFYILQIAGAVFEWLKAWTKVIEDDFCQSLENIKVYIDKYSASGYDPVKDESKYSKVSHYWQSILDWADKLPSFEGLGI